MVRGDEVSGLESVKRAVPGRRSEPQVAERPSRWRPAQSSVGFVNTEPHSPSSVADVDPEGDLSEIEVAEIEARLRALGYIE